MWSAHFWDWGRRIRRREHKAGGAGGVLTDALHFHGQDETRLLRVNGSGEGGLVNWNSVVGTSKGAKRESLKGFPGSGTSKLPWKVKTWTTD